MLPRRWSSRCVVYSILFTIIGAGDLKTSTDFDGKLLGVLFLVGAAMTATAASRVWLGIEPETMRE